MDFAPVEKRLTALIDDLSKEDQEALAGELGLAKSHLKRLKKVTASLHGAITNLFKEQAPTCLLYTSTTCGPTPKGKVPSTSWPCTVAPVVTTNTGKTRRPNCKSRA